MKLIKGFAIIGLAACVVWIAWLARKDTTIRIAFDNRGYPPELVVQLKLDDAADFAYVHARCTPIGCQTDPMLMDNGRHRLVLRVLIGSHASVFTETTIER